MSSGEEYESGSYGSGDERGFKLKKHKKEKGGKDKKKDKEHKDKDKEHKDKDKKDKKDKDHKDKDKKDKKDKDKDKHPHPEEPHAPGGPSPGHGHGTFSGPGYAPPGVGAAEHYLSSTGASFTGDFRAPIPGGGMPPPPPPYAQPSGFPQTGGIDTKQVPYGGGGPPPPPANAPPPSGYRVPLATDAPFATNVQTGPPVTYDLDGSSPLFIGSALFQSSVQPCKIGPHLRPYVSVSYAGEEHAHNGRYDLLPFVPEQMEWVRAFDGHIPPGRRPIEGGYEENGAKLYHALGYLNGVRVPGKAGEHLSGANVPFGGGEHHLREYDILCWKI